MKVSCLSIFLLVFVAFATSPVLAQDPSDTSGTVGGVKGLEKRIKHLEQMIGREVTGHKWYERFQLSGLIFLMTAL